MRKIFLSCCFILCFNFLSAQNWKIVQEDKIIYNLDGTVAGYWTATFIHREDESVYCGYIFGKRVKTTEEKFIAEEKYLYRVSTNLKKYIERKVDSTAVCTEYEVFKNVPSKGEYILIDNKKIYGN